MPVAARVARLPCLTSLAAPPSSSPRNGGTSHGAETLIDVEHRQIFAQEWLSDRFTPGPNPSPGPGSSASPGDQPRPPPRYANRPHAPWTPPRLRLRRRCSSIRRARGAVIEQPQFALRARARGNLDILRDVSYVIA